MKALDRKLLRDLISMWGQVLAIALVIASGVATYVMSVSTFATLSSGQQSFYQDYRLADVFVTLRRAPESLAQRIAELDGVEQVETRISAQVSIDIADFDEPISGLLLSLPDNSDPLMNQLYLRQGRLSKPDHDNEVVVNELFAREHELQPGDDINVIINGYRKTLTVVGIALSPEHIFVIQPGSLFPDNQRYGVLWMRRAWLSAAYDMEGAFNDLTVSLFPGSSLPEVLKRLDIVLQPYGSLGAYGREDQLSNRYLSSELQGLETMAAVFPTIFLGVAAFLLNVVINRLFSLQREQIAALKAFGYHNMEVGLHYLKLVMIIVLLGVVLGLLLGIWMGQGMSKIYMELFRFPSLQYQLHFSVIVIATLVSMIAAAFGTLRAVQKAVSLPPAVAMQAEPPLRYRQTWIERLGLKRWLSQPARMILRNLQRRPLKACLSVLGIAFACAILIIGLFQEDAVDYMVTVQFELAQRDDLTVTFNEPSSRRAQFELQSLPGVHTSEAFRAVPVRLRHQHLSYRTVLQGFPAHSDLQRLLDTELKQLTLPPAGIVLSEYLAEQLQIHPGDFLTVEILEGKQAIRQIEVAGTVKQYIGVAAYMELAALNRLLREGELISGAVLLIDKAQQQSIYRELHNRPAIAGVTIRENAMRSFYDTMGENLLIFAFFNTLLAGTIAFGVIYNSARIALSERSRELASLRVLGFHLSEVAYILIGELVLLTLLAIPLGFVIGRLLCAYLVYAMSSELYQIPLITEATTYAFAASVVLIATLISSLFIWRRLAHLDLVRVLKTRE